MTDQYIYLWAQWGILNYDQYQIVLKQFGDLEKAWSEINSSFLEKLGFGSAKARRVMEFKDSIDFNQLIRRIETLNIRILCVDDAEYPSCLKSIPNPSVFLFVRGKLPPLHKAIGIVGTRQITDYGKIVTERFARDLVRNGFVVISGLALGVDETAHKETVRNSGITVAVLGSGVDNIYPYVNRSLSERIIRSGGAVISEYPLGTPALQHHFPMRNRIISGLSRGVLVVEGGIKSGALITARYALEQGREVFAVPNNITKIGLSGTNHIIRRGEAKLVEKVNHILEDFQMEAVKIKQPISFTTIESELIERIVNQGKSIDELVMETHYNVSRLTEVFIELQLKGVVREINRKWTII